MKATDGLYLTITEASGRTRRVPVTGPRLILGRSRRADVCIDEPGMSNRHAEIRPERDGRIHLRDLDSLNGTWVNGRRVAECVMVAGDVIQVGDATVAIEVRPIDTCDASGPNSRRGRVNCPGRTRLIVPMDRVADGASGPAGDERMALLRDLSEALKRTKCEEEVFALARRLLQRMLNGARAFVLRMGPNGVIPPQVGSAPPSMTIASEAAAQGYAVLSTDTGTDDRFSEVQSIQMARIESAVAAPVIVNDQVAAVLYSDRQGGRGFDRRDLSLVGLVANHLSAVLENMARFVALEEFNQFLEQRVEERTKAIRLQADSIRELMASKDHLLGMAAHDIRNPLMTISMLAYAMRADLAKGQTESLEEDLTTLDDVVRQLATLLTDVLDTQAIESGRVSMTKRLCAADEIIAGLSPVCVRTAALRDIQVEMACEPDILVHADPKRVQQALSNLLDNAIKFSPVGGKIVVRGFKREGQLWLQVKDDGPGIPEDEVKRIFDMFVQGAAGLRNGGFGLGLVIARKLVHLHDGQIHVHSQPGVGTEFSIRLPLPASDRPFAGPVGSATLKAGPPEEETRGLRFDHRRASAS